MDRPGVITLRPATDVITLQKVHVKSHLANFVALKQVSSSLYESMVFRNIFVGILMLKSLGFSIVLLILSRIVFVQY